MLKGTSACCRKGDHNTTRKRIGFEANPRKAQMKKLLLILLVVGIAVFAAKQAGLIKMGTTSDN
jgi:hypothetical protein